MAAPSFTTGPAPYPSSDPGFEALPLSALLDSHQTLLGRIKLCFGEDRATFERDLLPLVHGYARFVHLLPATADNYFHVPGGLLQLGLETAFFSLQGTDAHIFSGRATISERREMEPRWRIATFVGGLCCEVHRALTHLIVTTADGQEWPAYLGGLAPWLEVRGADRYFVRWRPNAREARGLGLFALPHVVPAAVLQMLGSGNTILVPQLMASISGLLQHHEHNVLDGLVRRSMALVIDRNLLSNADRYGKPQYGSHLERYLVDALRRLVAGHSAWTPNRDKSRVWLGPEGLFLVWPGAADDVLTLLEGDQLAGIPKSPQTLMEILLEAGVLVAPDATGKTWVIQPPGTKAPMDAVKLANPAILLAGLEPPPAALDTSLLAPAPSSPHPKAGQSRADATAPHTQAPTAAVQASEPVTSAAARGSPSWSSSSPNSEATTPRSAQDQQLSLLEPEVEAETSAPEEASAGSLEVALAPGPQPPQGPAPVAISLEAPMRLNPAVRGALAEIVEKLNDSASTSNVSTVADGVFVPLEEFQQRGIQPGIAIRALNDAHMLRRPPAGGPPTVSRQIRDLTVLGVVVSPVHVVGLDPRAFTVDNAGIPPESRPRRHLGR
ncbi:MobH family relaxase [Xenophilus azovorans]|uniref:MobH family relaxase n=1 Tax=Xenophilus azovorans TaxID=151755 RepID=UPI00056E0F72|nr:MobH family relaxase [Xenophilus azovorans]